MWVFGFGSLMWDGWQEQFECQAENKAKLIGYQRRFNKASVRNWGTKGLPGPTLNVEDGHECRREGMAFQFSSEIRTKILDYLKVREGKAFELTDCKVILDSREEVTAVVPLYRGNNILHKPIEQLADMAVSASGTRGKCIDYVLNITNELERNGITDSEVQRFSAIVNSRATAQQGHPVDARTSRD